ncbi:MULTISPECIES: T9SS type A sorting domain-containing protein [unclassified Saccharicrinis]|uniref:T9SS type A sorting domain-containing protein n=1 Tax=unclassified Saccharicrinis TaxID=2646859 RepID=UPI003D337921
MSTDEISELYRNYGVTTDNTSIGENIEFTVYPNPTSGIINIDFDGLSPKIVKVYNFIGNLLYSEEHSESRTLNLNDIGESGIYLIQVIDTVTSASQINKVILK